MDPDQQIVAICFEGKADGNNGSLPIWRLVLRALFASQDLREKSETRFIKVPFDTDIGLLEFDMNIERMKLHAQRSYELTKFTIEKASKDMPAAFDKALTGILGFFSELAVINGLSANAYSLRCFVAFPHHEDGPLKIRYSRAHNIAQVVDDRILLPLDTSLTGMAFASRRVHYASERETRSLLNTERDRYRRALKWKELKWCLSVPVFVSDRENPVAAVAIECNVPIGEFGILRMTESWKVLLKDVVNDWVGPALNATEIGAS